MSDTASPGWRRFLGLPSTWLGWASFVLLVAFFAMALIGQGQLGIDTRWVNLVCLLSSAIAGFIALVFKRDRSWLVWLPVVFAVLAFGGEIVQAIVGGG
jgi:hypothetical protein